MPLGHILLYVNEATWLNSIESPAWLCKFINTWTNILKEDLRAWGPFYTGNFCFFAVEDHVLGFVELTVTEC